MGRHQREKGKRGEREAAKAIKDYLGIEARRGKQYQGGHDSPDIKADLPGVNIEVKRVERLSLYDAMGQACEDAGECEVPLLLHRRNNKEWLAVVPLKHLLGLAIAVCNARENRNKEGIPNGHE